MFRKIWDWFDGNKTTIGSVCIAIAAHVPADVEVIGISVQSVLYWLGGAIGGTGVAHKVGKKVSRKGS